jgi:hypothetical protein
VDRDCRLGYKCQLFSAGQKRACFLEQIEWSMGGSRTAHTDFSRFRFTTA